MYVNEMKLDSETYFMEDGPKDSVDLSIPHLIVQHLNGTEPVTKAAAARCLHALVKSSTFQRYFEKYSFSSL
jgi:hypothetical protein